MASLYPLFDLLGRILISIIFLFSGYGKITNYTGTQGYMAAAGVPGTLLPLVIAVELLGAALLILGWQTRLVAFLLAGFCLVSALLFHFNLADQMQSIQFMKNLAIAGGFLGFVAHGAGPWSLDRRAS